MYWKIRGKIKELYGKQSEFAKAINLSERSLSLKLNGERDWKQREIAKACELLHIDENKIGEYFFSH